MDVNRIGVIQEKAHHDEVTPGAVWVRPSDVWGARTEARAAYERGIEQAEKFGHGGMAEDLRLALIQLRE